MDQETIRTKCVLKNSQQVPERVLPCEEDHSCLSALAQWVTRALASSFIGNQRLTPK